MLKKNTKVYTAFSEYTVEKQINQGGNGTVYLVHDQNGDRYALKAIDREKTSSDKLKRFKNEITFCENNSNPHVIKVLDHGAYTEDGVNLVFYIMHVYEKTLRDMMKEGIEPEDVLPLVTQILSGLRFAHEKNVWHRDIKPENILIDRNGYAVIADFGIAHFSADELATFVETQKSDRMANFQYAAPEQRIKGGKVDGRADIYAVGLILNEMFTHTLPLGVNYKKISGVCSEYGWLDSVVDLMLQQDVSARLYPASNVATRILAAQKDWKQSQELLRLVAGQPDDEGPYQMKVPTVRDNDYADGQLIVYLDGIDKAYFSEWFNILQIGHYGHSETVGYETYKLKCVPPDCIALPIPGNSSWGYRLGDIAQQMKTWFVGATNEFNEKQRIEFNRKQNAERVKKEAEIQRLKRETEMREAVKGMFE